LRKIKFPLRKITHNKNKISWDFCTVVLRRMAKENWYSTGFDKFLVFADGFWYAVGVAGRLFLG